jgi:hypothetical protein
MWAAFLALNLVDVGLTSYLLAHGGSELNPLMQADYWILLKLSVVVLVILLLRKRRFIMRGLVVGMSLVVAWNLLMAALV